MAKHLILLVHGVGDTKPKWSESIATLLKAQYAKFSVSRIMPFDDHFKIVEVNYNAKFDAQRTAWKTAGGKVAAELGDGGLSKGAVGTLTKWAQAPAEDQALYTHALDVLFYRLVGTVSEQVRASVQLQILTALNKLPANDVRRWSIIAHSLGTAVTHDVLHQMFSPNRPPEWGPLPPGVIRPSVVMMVANVSRLAENKEFFGPNGDVFKSSTFPNIDVKKGSCDYYLNVRHDFDPIPKPKRFKPVDDWPDLATRADKRYEHIAINAVDNPNVHDFAHYLRNPKTVVPLFRLLTSKVLLPDEEAKRESDKYEESTPLGKFKKAVKKLEDMSLGDGEDDWKKVLGMFEGFYRMLAAEKDA
jgi:hypothetical protein